MQKEGDYNKIQISILKLVYEEYKETRGRASRWSEISEVYGSTREVKKQLDILVNQGLIIKEEIKSKRKKSKKTKPGYKYNINPEKEKEVEDILKRHHKHLIVEYEKIRENKEQEIQDSKSLLERYGLGLVLFVILVGLFISVFNDGPTDKPPITTSDSFYVLDSNGTCVADERGMPDQITYRDRDCTLPWRELNISKIKK